MENSIQIHVMDGYLGVCIFSIYKTIYYRMLYICSLKNQITLIYIEYTPKVKNTVLIMQTETGYIAIWIPPSEGGGFPLDGFSIFTQTTR